MRRIKTTSQLQDAVGKFRRYFDALGESFVDRDHIIEMMMYALAMRQHLLVFGPPGTAKTAVSDMAFSGITGAERFMVELSLYMTEDAIFGPLDPKKMREDGELWHRTDGMLPKAHFARLGEFLDANMSTLRTLLGALHERRFQRGTQVEDMPLLTVYCDTNVQPGRYLKSNPNAWAVLDRLLFIEHVDFLSDPEFVAEMITRFQRGHIQKMEETLDLGVIHDLSNLIVRPPSILRDKVTIAELAVACVEYRKSRREMIKKGEIENFILPDITDRRIALASQLTEVKAIFRGRLETKPEDIVPVGLVLGTTDAETELWNKVAGDAVGRVYEAKREQLEHAQAVALDAMMEEAAMLAKQVADPSHETSELSASFSDFGLRLEALIPEDEKIDTKKTEVLGKFNEARSALRERALEELDLG